MTERRASGALAWTLSPWVPWLLFAVVVIVTLTIAVTLYRLENRQHQTHFALVANEQMNVLATGVHMRFRPVQHVATTFSLQLGGLDERDFHLLAQSIPLAGSPALLALQWWGREPGAPGQEVFVLRHSYHPTAEVPGKNDADLSTIPPRALAEAREQRGLFIAPWYEAHGQVRLRVLRAVFAVAEEHRLLGFVSGVYRVDRLLEEVLCPVHAGPIELFVSDPRARGTGAFRCLGGTARPARADAAAQAPGHRMTRAVPIEGVRWTATAIARPGAFTASYWIPIAIALSGLLLGAVLVLFHRSLLGREAQVRNLVHQRTEELAQRTEALDQRNNELETVYRSAPVGLAVLDRELRFRRINDRMAEFNGVPLDAHFGKTPRELSSWIADATEELGGRIVATGKAVRNFEFQSAARAPFGAERFYNTQWLPLKDDTGQVWGINVVFDETTERRRLEMRARHLAEHDALTDLPNRRLLLELLDAALRSAQRSRCKVALLFLDLDNFKAINDTLGHEAGDTLLKGVAVRLLDRVRRSDIVARLGGDEFTVIISELSRGEQAGEVAEEIVRTFRNPFHLADQNLYVTTSLGISLYPDDSDTAEGLLRRADLAMYEAKDQGRNTYRFYNRGVDRRARERARIENSLRQALKRDELRVVYQPEFDLHTGRLIGVEALARWHHPELGRLKPARFIPVAEESDLIVSLDDWVLRTACAQARRWLDEGYAPIKVSVNLSAKGFERSDLVESVRRHLAESGLDPTSLELELTEHTVMRRIDQSIERMRELISLGVDIAIDDFGTGYSSLSYLKRLPMSKLKIDQSFVRDIATDDDDRAIIQSVTALAHRLNRRVIAEGVETTEQQDFLTATGCDEAQGYLFSKPLPPDEVGGLLAH